MTQESVNYSDAPVFLLMLRCRFTIFARFDKIPERIQALDGVIPEGLPYECDT